MNQVAEQAEHGSVDRHLIENVGELLGVQVGPRIMGVAQSSSVFCVHAGRLATKADQRVALLPVVGMGKLLEPRCPVVTGEVNPIARVQRDVLGDGRGCDSRPSYAPPLRPTDRSDAATRRRLSAAFRESKRDRLEGRSRAC